MLLCSWLDFIPSRTFKWDIYYINMSRLPCVRHFFGPSDLTSCSFATPWAIEMHSISFESFYKFWMIVYHKNNFDLWIEILYKKSTTLYKDIQLVVKIYPISPWMSTTVITLISIGCQTCLDIWSWDTCSQIIFPCHEIPYK